MCGLGFRTVNWYMRQERVAWLIQLRPVLSVSKGFNGCGCRHDEGYYVLGARFSIFLNQTQRHAAVKKRILESSEVSLNGYAKNIMTHLEILSTCLLERTREEFASSLSSAQVQCGSGAYELPEKN